uniref:Uncharacterized protein n=1 Tax=Otolemur garnettii TaxID=30611 RepID=H0Y066_OTOGA
RSTDAYLNYKKFLPTRQLYLVKLQGPKASWHPGPVHCLSD